MTQLFSEDGRVARGDRAAGRALCRCPAQDRTERDGYRAVQLGLVDPKSAKRANKPMRGHHQKADLPPTRLLREFAVDEASEAKAGDSVLVDIFEDVARVDVIGTSKGKGFQGVMKRHGFSGGRATHGSMFHRAPGSIGMAAYPSKVLRGMRGPGQTGNVRVTTKNLKVLRVDKERNLLLVEGSVPGSRGGHLLIRRSVSQPAAAK